MSSPRRPASIRDVFLHRSLLVRYILLPGAAVVLLWTLFELYEPEFPHFHHSHPGPVLDVAHGFPDVVPPQAPAPPPPPPPPFPPPAPAVSPIPNLNIPPHSSISTSGSFLWSHAAQAVKDAFVHAYHGYEQFAAPHDELRPVANGSVDNFNGWGVTIFDSLDTMLLMNLTEDFDRAMVTVSNTTFALPLNQFAPFFETTIRYLGGLLSAYGLSGNPILLQKADELGTMLSPIFETASGLPLYDVNTVSGVARWRKTGFLAEVATCQPEYTYLAKITGKKEHWERADKIMKVLDAADTRNLGGALPTNWDLDTGKPIDQRISLAGLGDSGHEYLLKQYLLTGKSDTAALKMYLRATTHIIMRMLHVTPTRQMLVPASSQGAPPHDALSPTYEHLVCFLPGLFALGVKTLPLDDLGSLGVDFEKLGADISPGVHAQYVRLARYKLSDVHRWAAEGMAEACAVLYADQASGLGPEEVTIFGETTRWIDDLDRWHAQGRNGLPPATGRINPVSSKAMLAERDYSIRRFEYELRPETIESMYLLWRMSGHERWREYGLMMFLAIERETKTASGYSTIYNVDQTPAMHKNSMPSFFLAETLKYLYLLFTDEDLVPLDKWVFNTEAHPLPVFHWSAEEKANFGIP